MPHPRAEGPEGVVGLVPGGEEEEEEGEVPLIIITLVKGTAMEGVVATRVLPQVLGVVTEGEEGEVAMEHLNRAMGKSLT